MMESSARKRLRISDVQRNILEKYFEDGMVGTGVIYKEKVNNASNQTGLTKAQVEKWIGNQKRNLKRPGNSASLDTEHSTLLKRAKCVRGPNAYNMFCSDFFKSDECKGLSHSEKNKLAAEKWSLQNLDEKKKYGETAESISSVNVTELDENQKRKLIERHSKKLQEEVMILEDLGCQISTLMVDNVGVVLQLGSNEGNRFLSCNPEIGLKFRGYFGCSNRKYRRNDVQDLFNKKYSEAIGKNCRVPYSKRGFCVIGLPEGITFKKPYNYGACQLKKIMESADNIRFIIDCNGDGETDESLPPLAVHMRLGSDEENMRLGSDEVKSLLVKIAGSDAAERVLFDSLENILEEEVEVVDLQLTEEERVLLYSCSNYFSPDAWLAVGQNMQHSNTTENLLLPVYTTADERFWLFRSNTKPSRIAKCVYSTKIRGQWLDLKDNGTYSFVHDDVITGKNLIRSAHGPLYFVLSHAHGTNFTLPDEFRNAIVNVLGECVV